MINAHIANYETGSFGTVYDIGLPWEVCSNDDEMITYVNYCFKVIGLNNMKLSVLSVFKDGECVEIGNLLNEIVGAHNRINTCYRVLNGTLSPVMRKHVNTMYTGTLRQGK